MDSYRSKAKRDKKSPDELFVSSARLIPTHKEITMATKKQQAIADVFGSAPTAAAPKKTTSKKTAEEVEMSEGFDLFVALSVVESLIKQPRENIQAQMRSVALDIFDDQVREAGATTNFKGVRNDGEANVQCKKRSAGIPADMRPLLDEHGISYDVLESTEKRYIINPEIMNDQDLLGKLAVALRNAPGLEGVQVVQVQEATVKLQTNEATMRDIKKIKNPEVRKSLLEGITTIAFSHAKMPLNIALEILKTMGIFKV
jgi:hypothetical protein